eukprot:Gregarina_sp_Poly_1__8021@NODE_4603_length_545_cov_98_646444_g3114_i0_p1_GENE_NODE_4603_length_545_cov_98_646444_g3114_i0NODE_4603_length_545_cov_98_646444_g3114_i0_p1_ORF_typecomplete_len113_score12_442OGFeII_Oxy_2/PF13532_6/8_9e08TetR/PF13972_6/0_048JAKMIP_CC3/PF16034_5/0_24_NODE_4603_length_545_cov_98_646444_g3114_i0147485
MKKTLRDPSHPFLWDNKEHFVSNGEKLLHDFLRRSMNHLWKNVSFFIDQSDIYSADEQLKSEIPKVTFQVCHGDLLFMDSFSQIYYKHTVPKEKRAKNPRVNLTLRRIKAMS